MSSRQVVVALAVVLFGISLCTPARAQISDISSDGWHSWRVPAVVSAPEMCCYSWNRGMPTEQVCDLDSRRGGFSSAGKDQPLSDEVQLYALLESGRVANIRALSSSCRVTAASDIQDHGQVDAAESIDWLRQQIVSNDDFATDAVAAAALHDGDLARDLLVSMAEPGNDQEIREDAIFWMAEVRIGETAADIKRFIFEDSNAGIREHAAFSYAQSDATDIADVLIQQGRNDSDPEVRSRAWFWLAQTGAAESESEINRAILRDQDHDVREEAVFALSQLPEDRSVAALARILQDKELDSGIRETALFWLVESDSDKAFEYVDEILSDN